MAHVRYRMDNDGLNRYLRESRELRAVVRARAELGAKVAKALAPVDPNSRHPGSFRDSIHVEDHPVRDVYGFIYGARIVADSENALWAEIGRTEEHPYEGSRALRRAANYLRVPKRAP